MGRFIYNFSMKDICFNELGLNLCAIAAPCEYFAPEASSTKAILIEDMKALGEQKLDLIERENQAYEPVMTQVLNNAFLSEPKRIKKGEIRDWLNSLLD